MSDGYAIYASAKNNNNELSYFLFIFFSRSKMCVKCIFFSHRHIILIVDLVILTLDLYIYPSYLYYSVSFVLFIRRKIDRNQICIGYNGK